MFKKVLIALVAMAGLSGCSLVPQALEQGDSPEETCDRVGGVIEKLSTIDLESLGFGELFSLVGESFAELGQAADDAQDTRLGESIELTMDTLNSAIAAGGGDLEVITEELAQRLNDPEVQAAAETLRQTCGTDISMFSAMAR